MKLEILNITNNSIRRIGSTGILDFTSPFIEKFSLCEGNRYLIAFDKSDNKIYLIPTIAKNGAKLLSVQGVLRLKLFSFLKTAGIKCPCKCEVLTMPVSTEFPKGTLCLSFL